MANFDDGFCFNAELPGCLLADAVDQFQISGLGWNDNINLEFGCGHGRSLQVGVKNRIHIGENFKYPVEAGQFEH